MIALLLAAGLAAQPASPLREAPACPPGLQHAADPTTLMRPQDWAAARVRKLGDLPRAKAEFAVMRLVDGCMVPAPARYRIPAN